VPAEIKKNRHKAAKIFKKSRHMAVEIEIDKGLKKTDEYTYVSSVWLPERAIPTGPK
jgi:hypothetical protein